MAILQLVDQLSEMLNQGKEVPLSRYRMVDAAAFAQMLERMRISVPSSVRESEKTLAERDKILAEARAEAEQILADAKMRSQSMLKDDQLIAVANREAEQIIEDGRRAARQQMAEADDYAIQVLKELSERLKGINHQVDNGIRILSASHEGKRTGQAD